MIILALDTTTAPGSVALVGHAGAPAVHVGDRSLPHAARLPADFATVLEQARVSLVEVDLFAVAAGPGSFTGIRIGIAAIQGLAFARRRDVASISTLDALAHAALDADRPATPHLIAAWMDAQRGEIYSALYEDDGAGRLQEIDPPINLPIDASLARLAARARDRVVLFQGDGAVKYRRHIDEMLGDRARLLDPTPPLAPVIAALASRSVDKATPPDAVRPLYVRRPDAELARERSALAAEPTRQPSS